MTLNNSHPPSQNRIHHLRTLVFKGYPPLLSFILVTVTAEVLVRFKIVHDFIVPSPTQVIRALIAEQETLIQGTLSTLFSSASGLVLSFMIGSILAILLSLFPILRRAIYPYAVFFQTVPIISIAPLLVIWFGYGQSTVVASSFIVSIFPILASTLLGLQSTDPQLVDLFQFYGASQRDYILKLKIPFALPYIFSGLRIAAGLSVVGAIVGEFIGGGGLGGIVDSARTQQRIDLVFAAVFASSILGLILIGVINALSWVALHRWHASAQN